MNLGNTAGHPRFVMSTSFANQVLAQIELHSNTEGYPLEVHILPNILDEKGARSHLHALGVELTVLAEDQARDLRINKNAP